MWSAGFHALRLRSVGHPAPGDESFAALLAAQGLIEVFDAANGKHAALTLHGSETLAQLIAA